MLGLTEVPVRIVDVAEPCPDSDRMQLETTRAALDVGRRRIDPPASPEADPRSDPGGGPASRGEPDVRPTSGAAVSRGRARRVPTQRERGQAVGMSERAVRRLDRIVREAPPDVLDAVRTGTLSAKAADRRLARSGASQVPSGPVRARETRTGGDGEPGKDEPVAADPPRGIGSALRSVTPQASPGSTTPVGDAELREASHHVGTDTRSSVNSPARVQPMLPSPPHRRCSPAVEAFMAVCRAPSRGDPDFVQETAHWTGNAASSGTSRSGRASASSRSIWTGWRAAGETRPGET